MSNNLGQLHMRYWTDRGACKGSDRSITVSYTTDPEDGEPQQITQTFTGTELFYPPRVKEAYAAIAAEAKKHCFGENGRRPCPVKEQCLEWAIETNELWGIFGGMSHRERNAFVRKRHRLAQEAGEPCTTRCIYCEQLPDEDDLDD